MSTYNEILDNLTEAATDLLVARRYYRSKKLEDALQRLRTVSTVTLKTGLLINDEKNDRPPGDFLGAADVPF